MSHTSHLEYGKVYSFNMVKFDFLEESLLLATDAIKDQAKDQVTKMHLKGTICVTIRKCPTMQNDEKGRLNPKRGKRCYHDYS